MSHTDHAIKLQEQNKSVMVYIPSYVVKKLDALSVYDVAEKLGLIVSRDKALCFMHHDHHPSLFFKKSNNSWKCYVCDKGGHSMGHRTKRI